MISSILGDYPRYPGLWGDDESHDPLGEELDDEDLDEVLLDPMLEPESRPDLAACPEWLAPWASEIVRMRAEGLAPAQIAWRVERLANSYYLDQGAKRLAFLKSSPLNKRPAYITYPAGARVSHKEISDALWLMDIGRLPDPPEDGKYFGFLHPFVGKILQMHAAHYTLTQIRNWIIEYQRHAVLNEYHSLSPSKSSINYVLRRELKPPKPPKPKAVIYSGPSDLDVYYETLDCVYAAWAAEQARTWRTRSRPIDMGGPRDVWIEDLPWEAVAA